MQRSRTGFLALAAILILTVSAPASAEMMRAFWAGSITDIVSGDALELAIGSKLYVEMDIDNDWISSLGFSGPESMQVAAQFYYEMPSQLGQSSFLPDFVGEIRLMEDMHWQAYNNNELVAAGTWTLDSIKYSPRVIPIPAALPMLLGALGLLAGIRRRS